jgi:hypothetical protein
MATPLVPSAKFDVLTATFLKIKVFRDVNAVSLELHFPAFRTVVAFGGSPNLPTLFDKAGDRKGATMWDH